MSFSQAYNQSNNIMRPVKIYGAGSNPMLILWENSNFLLVIMGAKILKLTLPPHLRAPCFQICQKNKKNPEKVTPSWRTDHLAMLKDREVGI